VVHGIVHVSKNVYEIKHELIYGICDPERDLQCHAKCDVRRRWMRMMNKYHVESKAKSRKKGKLHEKSAAVTALRLPYWCPARGLYWRERERSSTVATQCGTLERSSRSKEAVFSVDTPKELESRQR
jgi:hypothetical protein